MQKFTTKIVNMMKAERLYESQGGPIILSQVFKILHCILFSHIPNSYPSKIAFIIFLRHWYLQIGNRF